MRIQPAVRWIQQLNYRCSLLFLKRDNPDEGTTKPVEARVIACIFAHRPANYLHKQCISTFFSIVIFLQKMKENWCWSEGAGGSWLPLPTAYCL
jgi:hypothetical protein